MELHTILLYDYYIVIWWTFINDRVVYIFVGFQWNKTHHFILKIYEFIDGTTKQMVIMTHNLQLVR